MLNLYRTYTVSVQDSTTFVPDNDLELLLYEGRVEVKTDPLTSKKGVCTWGTTSTAIPVYDKNGIPCTALVADAIERPGEYDFKDIDLNKSGSLSYYGETLYSVVARPTTYDPSDEFASAKIVVDSVDLSDTNIKQIVRASIGGASSLTDNIVIAGGSVTFDQYTNGVVNHNYDQHLKITNLPSDVTNMTETATSYPTFATSTKLCLRFNVYYSNGTDVIRWEGVPCYKTSDNSWVIHVQRDQYNTYRSKEFGGGGFIDLGAIWQNFIITLDPSNNNVFFRRFDTNPTIALPTTGSTFERTIFHSHVEGTEPIAGIGAWTYATAAETPYYNLDVVGTRGARVRISTTPKLSIDSTAAKIGYNTGTNYFGSSNTSAVVVVGSLYRFSATSSDVKIGYNVLTCPRIVMDATSVKTEGAANTYLLVNTSNQVYTYIAGNPTLLLDTTQSVLKFGSSFTFALGSTVAFLQSATNYNFYTSAGLTAVGHNFASTPITPAFVGTATYARLQGSTTTYFSATSANQLYAYQGSNQAMAIDSTQTTLKFNTNYTLSLLSGSAYLQGATGSSYRWHSTPTVTVFGHDFTTSYNTPLFRAVSTYVQMQSTSSTYLLINDSNEVWVNVNDTGAKRSIWLKTNDYRFGYYVNNTSGVYFKAVSTALYGMINNYQAIYADSSSMELGPNANTQITISTTPAFVVKLNGANIIYAASTFTKVYCLANNLTYIQLDSDLISFKPSTLSGVYANTDTKVGYVSSWGYLKIPYYTDPTTKPTSLPVGSMLLENTGGSFDYLWIYSTSGWVKTQLAH